MSDFPGTLRDWFAGQALTGILAGSKNVAPDAIPPMVAAMMSFGYADVMVSLGGGHLDNALAQHPQADSTRGEYYHGAINPGMHFMWEPGNPYASGVVVVTGLFTAADGTAWVEAKVLTGTQYVRPGHIYINEESRFREAVRPCDELGRLLGGTDGKA